MSRFFGRTVIPYILLTLAIFIYFGVFMFGGLNGLLKAYRLSMLQEGISIVTYLIIAFATIQYGKEIDFTKDKNAGIKLIIAELILGLMITFALINLSIYSGFGDGYSSGIPETLQSIFSGNQATAVAYGEPQTDLGFAEIFPSVALEVFSFVSTAMLLGLMFNSPKGRALKLFMALGVIIIAFNIFNLMPIAQMKFSIINQLSEVGSLGIIGGADGIDKVEASKNVLFYLKELSFIPTSIVMIIITSLRVKES